MREDQIKHLEFLQENIKRMNQCSFQMKGWAITLVTAILGIMIAMLDNLGNKAIWILLIAMLPIVSFWLLDSLFLTQEKDLIKTYNIVALVEQSNIQIKPFEIKPDLGEEKAKYWSVFFSKTQARFYFPLLLVVGIIMIFIHNA